MLIGVGNIFLKGNAPQICGGATPASQHGLLSHYNFFCAPIVNIFFVLVAHGDVACLGILGTA